MDGRLMMEAKEKELPYHSNPCGFAEAYNHMTKIFATPEEIAARTDGNKDPEATEDEIIARCDKASAPFIGLTDNAANRNSLQATITNTLMAGGQG